MTTPKETKAEAFKRLAELRVNNALHHIRLIGRLANKANYEYTQEQVGKIAEVLLEAVAEELERFVAKAPPKPERFRLEIISPPGNDSTVTISGKTSAEKLDNRIYRSNEPTGEYSTSLDCVGIEGGKVSVETLHPVEGEQCVTTLPEILGMSPEDAARVAAEVAAIPDAKPLNAITMKKR